MAAETTITATAANCAVNHLGESPVWNPSDGTVLWTDIPRGIIHTGALRADGTVVETDAVALAPPVSAVTLTDHGEWLIATGSECLLRTPDGALSVLANIPLPAGSRLNDAAADPAGRYLVGSAHDGAHSDHEVLVVLNETKITVLDDDLTLSNGLAWSTDGTVMYSVDSLRRSVYRRTYEIVTGSVGARSAWLDVPGGIPDGLCVDAEDHVWVAVWGAGEVRRYSPDAELVATVRLSAPHPTSVAFAGPDLDTLVITTATEGMSDDELVRFPDAGRLFTARPGVRGAPVPAVLLT